MKAKISILLCAVLSLASPGLYAATHTVLPGESIQAAITSASPGDQIIIKGGGLNVWEQERLKDDNHGQP